MVELDSAHERLGRQHPGGFPRRIRLVRPTHYRRVFERPLRISDQAFTFFARPNELGYPRLGLAISKRCTKKSVRRHRIKRLIRESFRVQQHSLPALDLVIVCRSVVDTMNNPQIFNSLERLWKRLSQKCERR